VAPALLDDCREHLTASVHNVAGRIGPCGAASADPNPRGDAAAPVRSAPPFAFAASLSDRPGNTRFPFQAVKDRLAGLPAPGALSEDL